MQREKWIFIKKDQGWWRDEQDRMDGWSGIPGISEIIIADIIFMPKDIILALIYNDLQGK